MPALEIPNVISWWLVCTREPRQGETGCQGQKGWTHPDPALQATPPSASTGGVTDLQGALLLTHYKGSDLVRQRTQSCQRRSASCVHRTVRDC